MIKKLDYPCFKCGKNLMAQKRKFHYIAVNDGVEMVCDYCYKYVYLNRHGFKELIK